MTRATTGFEPDDTDGVKHPLFLYFVGTRFVESDTSARYDSEAAKNITEAMARRGFVALSADYDNTLSLAFDKVSCTFASSNPMSLLQLACARPNVDCDLGLVTQNDCVESSADHCCFDRISCGSSAITLEPNWIDPASTKPFALEPNADWLAQTARRL